ncbi:hypothetical protein ACSSNL_07440 [Thalassobius sp. S69A]|uniref:hypothetical protein n=1 Tax=unclassified Thalassovita TaxID=2619711 RepID=UPI000C5CB59C|nr:hypothetical protein [Paracoccaceae bacterium]
MTPIAQTQDQAGQGIVPVAPRILCVGTHHKTGTIWMQQVFKALAAALDLPKFSMWKRALKRIPDQGFVLGTNWDSAFPADLMARDDVLFLHIIRDPRDVLLSGARYHETAPATKEDWLHEPRADFDGLTYQQKLLSIADPEERILFEMEHKHAETLQQMLDWDYANPNSIEWRYEDLIADTDCALFRAALTRLGLSPDQVETGVRAFWDNSLFGGMADPAQRKAVVAGHVSSGAARQWPDRMSRRVAQAYAERFGADLITLGYEKDTKWLEAL